MVPEHLTVRQKLTTFEQEGNDKHEQARPYDAMSQDGIRIHVG